MVNPLASSWADGIRVLAAPYTWVCGFVVVAGQEESLEPIVGCTGDGTKDGTQYGEWVEVPVQEK